VRVCVRASTRDQAGGTARASRGRQSGWPGQSSQPAAPAAAGEQEAEPANEREDARVGAADSYADQGGGGGKPQRGRGQPLPAGCRHSAATHACGRADA
jgi:hypothetical protein